MEFHNPLDALHALESKLRARSWPSTMDRMPSPPKSKRVSLTVRIRKDVADEARRVALYEAGFPRFLRLNLLVEQALIAYLEILKSESGKLPPSRNHQSTRMR